MTRPRARSIVCAIPLATVVAFALPGAARATLAPADTSSSAAARADSAAAGSREREAAEQRERLKETLELMGRREVEGERRWQRHKSGKVAMLSSALLPGLGQVYNGRRVKVAVMVGFASTYMAQIWLNTKDAQRARSLRDRLDPGTSQWDLQNRLSEYHEEEAVTWLWWTGAVWVIGILDAWTDAHLYDIRVFTPPPHDDTSAGVSRHAPRETAVRYFTLTFEF